MKRRATIVALGIAGIALGGVATAHEGDVFGLGAGVFRTHDDNVFRLPDNAVTAALISQRDDYITTSSVYGRFDKQWGRQRVRLDATLSDISYAHFNTLDYTGENLRGQCDWQLGNQLSGRVLATRVKVLTGFEDYRPLAPSSVRNLETSWVTRAFADYWLHPDWHAEANVERRWADNSTSGRQYSNYSIDEGWIGVRYNDGTGRELSLRARLSNGDYPDRVAADSFEQRVIDLAGRWPLTGNSRLTGSVGHISRTYDQSFRSQYDYSGTNGQLGWEWVASGKTAVVTDVKRQLSSEESDIASYRDTRALQITPTWAVSEQVSVQGKYLRSRISYEGDPLNVVNNKRIDHLRSASLNVVYLPQRWVSLSAGIQDDNRDSNDPRYPFKVQLITVGANFEF